MQQPLDVLTPLSHEHEHATKTATAWIVATAVAVTVFLPFAHLLGWPRVDYRVTGQVAGISEGDDSTIVTYVGWNDHYVVVWQRQLEDSEWELGETVDATVDENDRVHLDHQDIFAGFAPWMLGLLLAVLFGWALRRQVGLAIAVRDAAAPGDPPGRGYIAVVDDPTPRAMRPLVGIWGKDPTTEEEVPPADIVFKADDETGEDLISPTGQLHVYEAWIDTGTSVFSSARWIATSHGVVVPHRRALLGTLIFDSIARKAETRGPTPLTHGPPQPTSQVASQGSRHSFIRIIAGHVAGVAALILLAGLLTSDAPEGYEVPPASAISPLVWDQARATHGPTVAARFDDPLAALAEQRGVRSVRTMDWSTENGNRVEVTRWLFEDDEEAREMANVAAGLAGLVGDVYCRTIVVSGERQTFTVRYFRSELSMITVTIAAERPAVGELCDVVEQLETAV